MGNRRRGVGGPRGGIRPLSCRARPEPGVDRPPPGLLEEVARQVGERHGVEVRCLALDLADPGIGAKLAEAAAGLDLGDVVYNVRGRSARSALRHREVITTSKELSERLAELARAIHDRIQMALEIETESGPLTKLMNAFQTALLHDLDNAGFADMYAQTIAYGLLSARVTDPTQRTVDDLAAHMRTNPFLKELMETFLHAGGAGASPAGLLSTSTSWASPRLSSCSTRRPPTWKQSSATSATAIPRKTRSSTGHPLLRALPRRV